MEISSIFRIIVYIDFSYLLWRSVDLQHAKKNSANIHEVGGLKFTPQTHASINGLLNVIFCYNLYYFFYLVFIYLFF